MKPRAVVGGGGSGREAKGGEKTARGMKGRMGKHEGAA